MIKFLFSIIFILLTSCNENELEPQIESNSNSKIIEFISFNENQTYTIGEQAPNFTLNPSSSNAKDLRDFRGKIVMLEFSASWCSICKLVAPRIAEASRNLDTTKFAVIKIYDDYFTKEQFLSDAELYNSPSYKVWNGIRDGFDLTKLYDINAVPRAIFIDENGLVIEEKNPYGIENIAEYMRNLAS
jgi:thiol-disulfide isomerase/thioredoxin